MAHWYRPQPPPNSTIIEIESDDCCSQEPLTGRNFDVSRAKPGFFTKSDGEWQTFKDEMAALVKQYRREGIAFLFLPVVIITGLLFHPSFGPIAHLMPDNQGGIGIMVPVFLIGIIAFVGIQMHGRSHNVQIDGRIQELCRRASAGSGARIELITTWTGACKPKGARTYRGLYISPMNDPGVGGAAFVPGVVPGVAHGTGVVMGVGVAPPATQGVALPMAQTVAAPAPLTVTVPPTAKGGDTIAVQMPDGQSMNVVVPPGLNPGDPFQVQAPAPVVAAVATVVG